MIFLPLSIAFSQMCLTLLFVTYCVHVLVTKQDPLPQTPLNRPLIGYIGITLLFTPFAFNVMRSLKGLDSLFTIGVFYIFYLVIQDLHQLKKLTGTLLFFITLAALYGIIQHYVEIDLFRLSKPISFLKHVENDLEAPVRIPGFSSYMTFSGQLAMAIPLLYGYLAGVKNLLKKGFLTIALLLMIAALLWTYTRSAWLGTMCAMSTIGIMRSRKLWFVFLALFLLLALVAVQPELLDIKLRVFREKDIERLLTWKSTLFMILDHPLTGIGKGNYSRIVDQYRDRDFEFSSRAHAHNNLLQVTAEGGILVLLCFLWCWGVMFRTLYQTYRQIPEQQVELKMLSLGFLGALIAFFVHGFFEYNFGDSEVAMMMWAITGLSFKLPQLIPPANRRQTL